MTIDTNFGHTIDESQTPCARCGEARESHPPARYYAHVEDDPSGELLLACKTALPLLVLATFKAQDAGDAFGEERYSDTVEAVETAIDRAGFAQSNATVRLCKGGERAVDAALSQCFEALTRETAR